MRILFITTPDEDYLSDALLHGFFSLPDVEVIDFPKCEILFKSCPPQSRSRIRGGGFTLYTGLVDERSVDRFYILTRLKKGDFDLVVFSNIWRSWSTFMQWRPFLSPKNCILLDGEDTPQVYPYAGLWLRSPSRWFVPRATRGFLYFKREWTEDSQFNLWHRLLPKPLRRSLPTYSGLRTISFSIPQEKIVPSLPEKTKDFATHIVDPEVCDRVPGSAIRYAFTDEAAYYTDIQASRYGITTKKAGWDCLRHYEIVANATVPCFKNLEDKPETCAPYGFVSGKNCISYRSADDLFAKIAKVTPEQYRVLQQGAWDWARANTTKARAEEVLRVWRAHLARLNA